MADQYESIFILIIVYFFQSISNGLLVSWRIAQLFTALTKRAKTSHHSLDVVNSVDVAQHARADQAAVAKNEVTYEKIQSTLYTSVN